MINANSTVIAIHPLQELLDPASRLLYTYHAMAHTGPTLSSGGTVQIRLISLDLGTTKWREGTFEIVEKDNKASLCLRFNCGNLKFFQVLCFCSPDLFIVYVPWFEYQIFQQQKGNQDSIRQLDTMVCLISLSYLNNVKWLSWLQLKQNVKTFSQSLSRIQLTLKDGSIIVLDKVPQALVQRTHEYLKKLKQEKEGDFTLMKLKIYFYFIIITILFPPKNIAFLFSRETSSLIKGCLSKCRISCEEMYRNSFWKSEYIVALQNSMI